MRLIPCFVGLLLLSTALFAQNHTFWQTTHGHTWVNQGNCRLEKTSLRATIHPFSIDVEEEAVIGTVSTGWWNSGDSMTLEITGQFLVSPGTTIRSMLLWNGATMLKAKLKDRSIADAEYEKVVDRDKPVVIARDPALIEYLGNNLYRFKIYPVALGNSRKIRILYTVPITASIDGAGFEIKPAFLFGCLGQKPATVPLTINATKETTACYIEEDGKKRELQPEGTYMLPYDAFCTKYNAPASLRISTRLPEKSFARQYTAEESPAAGTYVAIVLSVNDVFSYIINKRALIDTLLDEPTLVNIGTVPLPTADLINLLRANSSIEATVSVGDTKYILDGTNRKNILSFIKTGGTWDEQVTWNVYNKQGDKIMTMQHLVPTEKDTSANSPLPLLWAAKYTFCEKAGNLGGAYGFVDEKMSLLALESDEVSAEIAARYAAYGVPPLLPGEIIIDPENTPKPPEESALFEYETGISAAVADHARTFSLLLLPGNLLRITANELDDITRCTVQVFDLSGRLLFRQEGLRPVNRQLTIALPKQLKGTCMVRIAAGRHVLTKNVALQ